MQHLILRARDPSMHAASFIIGMSDRCLIAAAET